MSKETVTIARNAVIAKLHNPSREAKLEVQRLLSYAVAGAEQSTQFKLGRWDGRSSFLDFRSGTFPAGFTFMVAAGLKRAGFGINIARKPLPEPLGPLNPIVDAFGEDPRYDYQAKTVEAVVKHGAIIAQVATGGGKSRICKMVYARLNRPTLFLTTRSILMYQMKEAFERDMGIQVSVLGDGQFGHTITDGNGVQRQAIKKMCVGMVQTLVAKLKEPDPKDPPEKRQKQLAEREKTIRLLSKFEVVIGEEAHEAGGGSYYEILKHCVNAHYRLALTATPFMRDDEEANMRLHAAFGPIGIKVSEELLIERGILAKPYFKFVPLTQRVKYLNKGTDWRNAYQLGIIENPERNKLVVEHARAAVGRGMPVMILVQRKEHGHALAQMLGEIDIKAQFIYGENEQDERKAALVALGNGELDVLIGTTILDVGVDVPAVGMVILAGGGKAEVAMRQRVGRGLRSKKSGPNVCLIVDFTDHWNKHLQRHSAQRQEIIVSTPGFGCNVLPPGKDFDYVGLGLGAQAGSE